MKKRGSSSFATLVRVMSVGWSPTTSMIIVTHLGSDIKEYVQRYLPRLQGEGGEELVLRGEGLAGCGPACHGSPFFVRHPAVDPIRLS
ncbi:MAG: hypothetical protein R6U70_08025 [Bacillota bacterium]